jgi:large subunit ribosomal protein L35
MPKNKPNKGLLKRIRITKSGKVKLTRACGRHLRSHKSSKQLRGYRKANYAVPAEVKRIRPLLPAGVKVSSAQRVAKPAETEKL